MLRAHELAQVAKGARRLPGGWIVDPVADIRQISAPRVWLHPAGENTLAISLGFSKRGGLFHVLVRHHDEPNDTPREEIQYCDLTSAFSKLAGLLRIMLDARQYRRECPADVTSSIDLGDKENLFFSA